MRRPSRIAIRLLAFNLLLLFLPIAGILYLDVYETRLLEAQERAMVQQGRLAAGALSAGAALDPAISAAFITRLGPRGDTRLRVYDAGGLLIADSNNIRMEGDRAAGSSESPYSSSPGAKGVRASALYRVGAWLARARRSAETIAGKAPVLNRDDSPIDSASSEPPAEVRAALAGRYGAATRPTPEQRSLTLTSAVPVRRGDTVIGAVLVSQSTMRVLQALYDVRLRIFEVVVASVLAAALLTALAAATVVRPIGRLRRQASDLAERRSRLPGVFHDANRRDEIGDLARALQELTRRLDEHIREVERFASDVSHEFKNPLASIRTAAEMAAQAEDPRDRRRFLDLLAKDVDRLDRLVSDVRDLARIDAQLEQEPLQPVDVGALLAQVIDGLRFSRGPEPAMSLRVAGPPLRVSGSADRLAQAFENILSNARSFTPAGTAVDVHVRSEDGFCRVSIADRGPGIPPAHLDRIFERFFTYRPCPERAGATARVEGPCPERADRITRVDGPRPERADGTTRVEGPGRSNHAGLGLAIAKTIVQGYGGTITASNPAEGGACFDVRLPRIP
jgi:two-component system sensor histidine kinase ChvG